MIDRFNNDNKVYRTVDNLEDQEDKFGTQIGAKYVSGVLLKHFCDLEKINIPIKIDLKIRCTLQTEIKKLFELKKKVTVIFGPDTQIVFERAPFVQYSQILPMKSFRQYLETIMLSSKVLRMGIPKTLYQKPYELQVGSQELDVDFEGCEKQFYRLKISLVYDKSDKDTTIYDSCNAECATRMIRNIELSNISDAYSTTNTILH